jgi:sugar/nucleoside kinase (ribokinase family)
LLAAFGWLKVRDRKDLASMSEQNLRAALRLATSVAALDCTKRGAEPPTLHELAVFDPEAALIAPGIVPHFNAKERIC